MYILFIDTLPSYNMMYFDRITSISDQYENALNHIDIF